VLKRSLLRVFLCYGVVMALLGAWASSKGILHPERMMAGLAGIRGWGVAGLVVINLVILLTTTGRWWRILSAYGHRIAPFRLAAYRVAAGAVSYVTPGTQFGGEPLQAFLLVDREGVPADVAAAGVLIERAMEFALNGLLVAGCLVWWVLAPFSSTPEGLAANLARRAGVGAVLVAAGTLAAAVFWIRKAVRRGHTGHVRERRLPGPVRRLGRILRGTGARIAGLFREDPAALWAALGLGLINCGFVVGEFHLLYGAVGLWLPVQQLLLVMAAARIGLWVPVPGGMGALEAGQLAAAQLLGIPGEAAMAVCLLIRVRDFLVCTAGLYLTGRYLSQSIKGNLHASMGKQP
jgi:uncharacterized protein (TIRG00374 family)